MSIQIQPTLKEEFIVLNLPINMELTRDMFPEKMKALYLDKNFKGTLSKDITDNIFVFRYDEYKNNYENNKYDFIFLPPYYFEKILEYEYNEHMANKNTSEKTIFSICKLNEWSEKSKLSEQEKDQKSRNVNVDVLNNNLNKYFDVIEKSIVNLSEQGKWHLIKWLDLTVDIANDESNGEYESSVEFDYVFETSESYKFYENKSRQCKPEINKKYYVLQKTIEYIKTMFPESHIETFYANENSIDVMIKF